MSKYKLIKEYPGSPELGTIAEKELNIRSNTSYYYREGENRYCIYDYHVEDNPEYWEKFNEYLWYDVFEKSYIQSDKEYFSPWNIYKIETLDTQSTDRHLFKSYEEAEGFITRNKPCLSLNDVSLILGVSDRKRDIFLELKKIVKSKL